MTDTVIMGKGKKMSDLINNTELDKYICSCPYFGGKNTADRSKYGTHIGSCALDGHYEKICPSERCVCAKSMGLKEERKAPRLIDAGELMRTIPSEEINARIAVYYSPTVEAITVEWIKSKIDAILEIYPDGNEETEILCKLLYEWEKENGKID